MKTLKLIFGTALALTATQASYGQITGTKHDFQSAAWNVTVPANQICKPCHTPHNASLVANEKPLWNHTVSVATYTMYANAPTFQATIDAAPSGSSKLCLSCHDGSVTLEAFGGNTAVTTTYMPGAANLGTNLSNDHPISMIYNAALFGVDPGLYNPTVALSGLGGTIDADMLDGADKMQCASCHNPHGTTFAKFLRKTMVGSALCLTCHNK